MTGRDAKDYAIEFGGYLATSAEELMNAINSREMTSDQGWSDEWRGLNSAIYEFRKRAQRAMFAPLSSGTIREPSEGAESEKWRDDPTSDERWNEGCDFAMRQLCGYLDVDPQRVIWDAATEAVDGDIQAVIGNILRAKFGEDWSPPASSKHGEGR